MSMKKNRIVVVGAGVVDVLVNPVDASVFEKGSVPVEHIKISTGGDALNESVILARLKKDYEADGCDGEDVKNTKVSLVTLLGTDDAGKTILSCCEREGIDTEFVTVDEAQETSVNIVMIQPDGSRSFFTNPKSTIRKLALEHIPEKFPDDAGILCMASIFVSSMLGNCELAEIFRRAKAQDMIICADMTKCKNQEKVSDMKETFSQIDYLFANEEEAAMVTGKAARDEMADEFLKAGVKHVIIKCGGEGCYVKSEDMQKMFPAVSGVDCIDTTGAGDTFAAGFICALSEGKTLEECAAWGNACGSITVEKVGACAGIQSRGQVVERLNKMSKQIEI